MNDFHFEDLDHGAASDLSMNGATASDIMAVIGLKSPAMAKRYVQVAGEHVHDCADALDDRTFGGEG